MNWIKKNPAQLSLAIAALVMMVVAFLLYSNSSGFAAQFQDAYRTPSEDNKIPPTDIQIVADRMESLNKPASWTPGPKAGSVFVSYKYLIVPGEKYPVRPGADGQPLHPPVHNSYIIKYGYDITSSTVLTDDTDKDGFSLLEEYAGKDWIQSTLPPALEPDSTDPTKAESHPDYHGRLYLVRIHKVPFRLIFKAADQNPRTKKFTIQINPLDKGNRTMFVEEGAVVPGTDWKFESFELKDQGDRDQSVSNMANVTTGQKLPLTINTIGDSPESFAIFSYRWVAFGGQPTKDFVKRKGDTFTLDPEPDKTYKVIEIKDASVEVLLPSGEKKTYLLTPNPPAVPVVMGAAK